MTATAPALTINGAAYEPDFSLFSREPLQSNVALQDVDAEPGERALNRYGWRRSQTDFIYGGGQEWFDQEDEANRRRFWQSVGFVYGTRGKLTSGAKTSLVHTFSSTTGVVCFGQISSGEAVVSANSEVVKVNSIASVTAYSGEPTGITSMVVIDDQVLVAAPAGMKKAPSGSTTFASFGTKTPDILVNANSRLLGMEGNEVYEIDDNGDQFGDTIFTHPFTNFEWKGGAAAPNGVYIWGDDGVNVDIYLLVPTDSTGTFAPPYPVAGDWPQGELIYQMRSYGSAMIIASKRGIRLAQIGGGGFLSYGPVLDRFGSAFDVVTNGELGFFPAGNVDAFGTTELSGIIGMRFDKFPDTLVPSSGSYALADLGTSCVPEAIGLVLLQTATLANFLPAFVAYNSDAGARQLWSTAWFALSAECKFRPGKITYGIPERKQFLSIEFEITGEHANDTFECVLDVDGTEYTLIEEVSGKTHKFTYDSEISGRVFDPTLTLTTAVGQTLFTRTIVELERWTIRALPLPEQVEVIEVGVILGPEVGSGTRDLSDHYAQWSALKALADAKTIVNLTIGDRTDVGFIDALMAPRGSQRDDIADGESGAFVQGTWIVRFVVTEDAAV